MAHIGIDLGTTNTLVAYLSTQGDPVIHELDNNKMIPSVVCIEEPGGHITVGEAAQMIWKEPDWGSSHPFRRWKLTMGEERDLAVLRLGGAGANTLHVTPEYLTSRFVEEILKQLSTGLGGIVIESVLVTVPHGWRRQNPEKCRSTRLAVARAKVDGKPLNVQNITVSEPVAAAAYWLWELRRSGTTASLDGKTLLICDIGGGTFDLSLVLVGAPDRPLDVLDAININIAGDYADALLCAWVCQQFNERFQTAYPTDADQVLAHLTDPDSPYPWLREWFNDAKKRFKEELSTRVEHARPGSVVRPLRHTFSDGAGHDLSVSLDPETCQTCLQPFYQQGRELIQRFLNSHRHHLPYALLPAGGGSRILGVREQILEGALWTYYTEPQKVEDVMSRIQANKVRYDEAIVLGAALIANKVVSVQERLLYNIGFLAEIPAILADPLKISRPRNAKYLKVWLSPVLKKGEALPARMDSNTLGITTTLMPGTQTVIEVVIEDDADDPWVQQWEIPHPGDGKKQASVSWSMLADTDGALAVNICPQQGQETTIEGRLERAHTGRASLVFGEYVASHQQKLPPRVTPEALSAAIRALGSQTGRGARS